MSTRNIAARVGELQDVNRGEIFRESAVWLRATMMLHVPILTRPLVVPFSPMGEPRMG